MTKSVLVSCMRNEGPFLLEWIAYHRAIGFDDILVITNDCADGSDEMLDRLDHLGIVTHLRNHLGPGEAPQIAGLKRAMEHPIVKAADWMLHIDADEFLNIASGGGKVEDLLHPNDFAEVIALLWRAFGNAGKFYWQGGHVLSSFTKAQGRPRQANAQHKSFFRPDRFGRCIDHMPKDPASENAVCVNALGEVVSNRSLYHAGRTRFKLADAHLTWRGACINHYAIRSNDVFLMKNDRGDGMGNTHSKYYLNSKFFRKQNKNDVYDFAMLKKLPDVFRELEKFLDDAEVRRLDRQALNWFLSRRDEILTQAQIKAWTLP